MRIARLSCVVAVVALACACGKLGKRGADGGPEGAGSAASGVKGMAAPDSDAKIVTLAKAALGCKWKQDSLAFDSDCADWKTWTGTNDAFGSATADATFVNMLEDADVKVRLLGSYHLGYDSERKFVTDAALSKRIVASAAAETQSHYYIDALAKALSKIQHAKTGTWPATKAALDGTQSKSMVRWALDFLLDYNETNQEIWDWVKSKTKDPEKSVAEWAVYGFGGLPTRKADACGVFTSLLPDDRVGGDAASAICLRSNECDAQIDGALDATEGRAKSGNMSDSDWATAMQRAIENVKTSDAQKKRAESVLTQIVSNTHIDGWLRASALRDFGYADKVKAKGLAAKFARDKDSSVASAAKDVLAKK